MSVYGEKSALLSTDNVSPSCISNRTLKLCCLPLILLIMAVTCGMIFSFYLPYNHGNPPTNSSHICTDPCVITLVESIPEGLTYPGNATLHVSTGHALLDLVVNARESISIASYYWSLLGSDTSYHDNSSKAGEDLFYALLNAGKKRNIAVRIVQNLPSTQYPDNDTIILASKGKADVRTINFTRLVGNGILHTKMWLIDGKHFYVGSANLDWRSLTQVKELGVMVQNCSCMAKDMMKIFDVYWLLAQPNSSIPSHTWPQNLWTDVNLDTPEIVKYNKTQGQIYLSSSPSQLCPPGRTEDINAILSVIDEAKYFIYIAVMDYFPTTLYLYPNNKYWPVIDDALRHAAFDRKVRVRLMASHWNHTRADMMLFLKSLQDINMKYVDVEVKLFEVPATAAQAKIPYARVNHNKYMVTDRHAYIGTSNWSGDYFIDTGGIGFILQPNSTVFSSGHDVRIQLKDVFNRDWYSQYAHSLSKYIN